MVVSALAASAAAGGPPTNPTLSDPDRSAVVNPAVVSELFQLARTRRIDLTIIGDSNVRSALVSGHEDGMMRAWSAKFGCYASRVDPIRSVGGWGGTTAASSTGQFPPFQGGAPSTQTAMLAFPNGAFPIGASYLPAGERVQPTYNSGLSLYPDHPIGIDGALRYHLTHWLFRTPTRGELSITVRPAYPGEATQNYAAVTGVRTASSEPGLTDLVVDVPAGPRAPTGILATLADFANNRGSVGPFYGIWHRFERIDAASGISFSPLLYQGGRTARAACEELQNLGPGAAAMQEWLRQVTRLQTPGGATTPRDQAVLAVQIIHGGNDPFNVLPSLGPIGGLNSNTPEGYKDNVLGIMGAMRQAWAVGGFDANNLYFILGPYHPRQDILENERVYERMWTEICGESPNTCAVRGTWISTHEEFAAGGWFASEVDSAHLSAAGYRAWGVGTLRVMQRAVCPADLNEDRANTVDDVFMFLNAWFSGDPEGDFDRSTVTTVDDLFEFLGAYFARCE